MLEPDISVSAFRRYLAGVKAPKTAERYTAYAGDFLRLMKANGIKNFTDLPPGLLGDFASAASNEGNAPATVRVKTYAVKKYLEWVESRGVVVSKQTKTELPRTQTRMRDCLQPTQISLYFRHADMDLEEPVRTAVMLLPCCGLRAQEVVGLRLDQIQRAEVQIKANRTKRTLALRVRGKGNKERLVPLMEEGVEILTGYLAGWRRRQPGPWLFPKLAKDPLVSGKNPITDRLLRAALQVLREPLGMDFTPHTMRRTYITMLYRKGMNLRTLANIAGHANIQTTINHYIAVDGNDNIRELHMAGSAITE